MAKTIGESLGIEFLLEEMANAGQARDALDAVRNLMAVFAGSLAKTQREGGPTPPADSDPAARDAAATLSRAAAEPYAPVRREDDDSASWKEEGAAAIGAIRAEWEKTAAAAGDALKDTRSWLDAFRNDPDAERRGATSSSENGGGNAPPLRDGEGGPRSTQSDRRDAWSVRLQSLLDKIDGNVEARSGADGGDGGKGAHTSMLADAQRLWSAPAGWLRDAFDFGGRNGESGEESKERRGDAATAPEWRRIAEPAFERLRDASGEIGDAIAKPLAGIRNSLGKSGDDIMRWSGGMVDDVSASIPEIGRALLGIDSSGAGGASAGGDVWTAEAETSGDKGREEDWAGRFGINIGDIGKNIDAARQAIGNGTIPLQQSPAMYETATRITNNAPVRVAASIYAPNGDASAIRDGLGGAVKNGVSQAFDNAAYNAEGGLGR